MDTPLALELRKFAARLDDLARDHAALAADLSQASNVATTLAHIISGKGFKSSFGAPGDWGYKTVLGNQLHKVYLGEHPPQILLQELNDRRYNWLRSRDLDTINQGGVFAGMTPANVILADIELDAAIDMHMAKE